MIPEQKTAPRAIVLGARPGTTIDLVPGKQFVPLNPGDVAHLVFAELVPAGGGTFRAVARVMPRDFANTAENLDRLKIPFSQQTMVRLITAGFIDGRQLTPGVHVFSYDSYLKHYEAAKDPEFWDTEIKTPVGNWATRRAIYSAAI